LSIWTLPGTGRAVGEILLAPTRIYVRAVLPVRVASRREFTGSWEYLVEGAIFTSPPHPAWSGAALISREGKLVGVGSLIVGDAAGGSEKTPGNMFVPIDRLPPILGDLIADGRVPGPGRPWLGVNADEVRGRLFVGRVTPGGPADKAGIKRGDVIVGVGGEKANTLSDLYRKVWARGPAGIMIPLETYMDRMDASHKLNQVAVKFSRALFRLGKLLQLPTAGS
jgi:S1-C subfamily serine protease